MRERPVQERPPMWETSWKLPRRGSAGDESMRRETRSGLLPVRSARPGQGRERDTIEEQMVLWPGWQPAVARSATSTM